MAFCLDMNLGTPPTVDGGCCTCPVDGGECTTEELAGCDRGVWEYENTCDSGCDDAVPVGDQCEAMDIVVTGQETFTHHCNTWCGDVDGPDDGLGEAVQGRT